jgi:hypothetical protein
MAARIAILVLAHRTAPLQALVDAIDDRFRLFIHLDVRCADRDLVLPRHARLIAPRRAVFWGGWSMMQATLDLMRAARDCDRLALVSGDTLPVLVPDALHAALADRAREYVELLPVVNDPALAGMPRAEAVRRYGWEQPWRFHNFVHWDHVLLNPLTAAAAARHYDVAPPQMDWIRGDVQRLVQDALAALPTRPRLFGSFWYGAQWWALTGETVAGLLTQLERPEVAAWFRHFPVPDEHMVQTVLGADPRRAAGGGRAGVQPS